MSTQLIPPGTRLGITSVASDGTLTPLANLYDPTNLDAVQDLSAVEVGGQPYLLAISGNTSDALVSYQINTDGSLTQVDIEVDGSGASENFLNNDGSYTTPSLLESFTNSNGDTFVVAGGAENGISLWTMNGAGQLSLQDARADDQAGATGDTDPEGNTLERDLVDPINTGLRRRECRCLCRD